MAGIDDVTPGVQVEGLDEAISKFSELGDAGAAAFAKMAEAATKVEGASDSINKVTTEGSAALHHLAEAGAEAFNKIMDAAMKGDIAPAVTLMFGEMAGAIAKVTEKAVEFVEAQASMVETLSNLGAATGMTIAQVEGLKDAFASVGISTNGFERSIGRLAITIGNEWTQIQQSVRTSADDQAGAMLHIQTTAFDVQKAYTAMGTALREAGMSAKQDALGIEEAALGLKRAQQALASSALEARSNALGVESAKLALIRAQMNLAKDNGQQVNPADEKALKLEQDKLAVKDAQLRIEEAVKKQAEQATETETKQLALRKARLEVEAAESKASEDAVKNSDRIRDAQLNIQKAQLAAREAQEKGHQQDLKDIPKIAQQVEQVAAGYKQWDDVMNHAEITATNLTKAVVLAASGGSGQPPKAMDVFKEMAKLFENMGDSSDAMNKKLEIVQHTMGAGFRAGQASAVQLLAVLDRGPEALDKFMAEAEKFSKVKIGGFDLDDKNKGMSSAVETLKTFNSSMAQMDAAIDQVKTRFAAMMSVPLAKWFEEIKESIIQPTGALQTLARTAGELFTILLRVVTGLVDGFSGIAAAVNEVVQLFAKMSGADPAALLAAAGVAALGLAAALGGIAQKLVSLVAMTAFWTGIIGLVTTAVGDLVKAWALLPKWMGGGQGTFDEGKKIEELGQAVTRAAAKMVGVSDKTLENEAKKDFLSRGILGETKKDNKDGTGGGFAADHRNDDNKRDKDDPSGLKARMEAQNAAAAATKDAASATKDAASATKDGGSATKDGGTAIKDAATTLGSGSSTLEAASGTFSQVVAAFGTVISNLAHGRSPSDVSGKATGGKISGPGGPRDDKAGLFALSDGEFVVQSAAVSHYGSGLFDALNSMAVGGFATGGAVGPRAPSVPASGGQGSQNIVNLSIDGHQFNGLRAPDNVAASLKTYAVGRQTSATGKKPSWVK